MALLESRRDADAEERPVRLARTPFWRKTKFVDALSAWALIAPALILFVVFILIPTVSGIGLSFFTWHFLDDPVFSGLLNFKTLVADPETWKSLGVTMKFVVLGVIPTVVIGFLLAVLTNARMKGVGALRVLYFVPAVVSVAVSAVLWGFLYDGRRGPIGALMRSVGLPSVDFLSTTRWALPALVVMMIWLALPVVILLYLAGLQRISPDLYDAAALDGAGSWRILWSITWPSVRGTTLVVAILQLITFVSGSLDIALILTNGDPLGSTRALGLYAYLVAFRNTDAGYASALSVLQLVVIVAMVVIGRVATRKVVR